MEEKDPLSILDENQNADYKALEELDPVFKEVDSIPSQQTVTNVEKNGFTPDPFIQGAATGVGALIGLSQKKDYVRDINYGRQRASDIEVMKRIAQQSAKEAAAAEAAARAQTPFERAIQGAPEDVTGTTGRARQQTYTTETSRQAQVRRGVDNPFTRGVWGATDQGVLAPPQAISEASALAARREAQLAQAALRRERLIGAAKASLSPILDWATKSKLLGTLGGGMAGYEGYEAYKAAMEGKPFEATMSGLSALGGALGTIPNPYAQVAGLGLSALPYGIRKITGREKPEE